ncbi:MAG: DUF92 domain-containing protein [Bacteroidota bacterium]
MSELSPQSRWMNGLYGLILGLILLGGVFGSGNFLLPSAALWALSAIGCAMGLAVILRKMDVPGALVGGVVAWSIFLGGGWPLLGLLLLFFALGVQASRFKWQQKETLGLDQEKGGIRSVRHAIANGGIASLLATLAWLFPQWETPLILGAVASLASATGDTLSSELGNVMGKRYWDIRSFRSGKRGLDGVISLEGSLAGIAGSLVIALAWGYTSGSLGAAFLVLIAGILGNLSDSFLGAYPQRAGRLNNDQVNALSTLLAGMIGMLLS